jgi:acyl carrier protein
MLKVEDFLAAFFEKDIVEIKMAEYFDAFDEWDSLKYIKLIIEFEKTYLCKLTPFEIQQMTSFTGVNKILFEKQGLLK